MWMWNCVVFQWVLHVQTEIMEEHQVEVETIKTDYEEQETKLKVRHAESVVYLWKKMAEGLVQWDQKSGHNKEMVVTGWLLHVGGVLQYNNAFIFDLPTEQNRRSEQWVFQPQPNTQEDPGGRTEGYRVQDPGKAIITSVLKQLAWGKTMCGDLTGNPLVLAPRQWLCLFQRELYTLFETGISEKHILSSDTSPYRKNRAVDIDFGCHCPITIFNNYSPKWRWIAVDIYRAASAR